MASHKLRKSSRIVSGVIVVLAIVFVLGLAYSLTNGFKHEPITIALKYENATLKNDSELVLPRKQNLRFEVGSLLTQSPVEYAVKVAPQVTDGNDFQFTCDGEIMRYSAIPDLTAAFGITIYTGYFTLTFPADMADMLQSVYPDSVISNLPDFSNDARIYFRLTVTSGKQAIAVNFCGELYVTEIVIDNGTIIF